MENVQPMKSRNDLMALSDVVGNLSLKRSRRRHSKDPARHVLSAEVCRIDHWSKQAIQVESESLGEINLAIGHLGERILCSTLQD